MMDELTAAMLTVAEDHEQLDKLVALLADDGGDDADADSE